MSNGVNKVILIGNLGKDPEVRFFPDGGGVTNFPLATSETWKDKQTGQKQERTEWHKVVAFGKLAEIAGEYLVKGSKVYIEGSLKTRKYEKEGQTHYSTEIVASEIQFLSLRDDSGDAPEQGQGKAPPRPQRAPQRKPEAPTRPEARYADFNDDIPF